MFHVSWAMAETMRHSASWIHWSVRQQIMNSGDCVAIFCQVKMIKNCSFVQLDGIPCVDHWDTFPTVARTFLVYLTYSLFCTAHPWQWSSSHWGLMMTIILFDIQLSQGKYTLWQLKPSTELIVFLIMNSLSQGQTSHFRRHTNIASLSRMSHGRSYGCRRNCKLPTKSVTRFC